MSGRGLYLKRLPLVPILVIVIVVQSTIIVGILFAPTPTTQTTLNQTTTVNRITTERAVSTILKPTKTPSLQLSYSEDQPGQMAVVVMTGLRPEDIIPANTMIEIRVVTRDGLLILDQWTVTRRAYEWYEFVIPKDANYDVCLGRPLYVSIKMDTPKEIYVYRGPLNEWRGIDDMCLPFTR